MPHKIAFFACFPKVEQTNSKKGRDVENNTLRKLKKIKQFMCLTLKTKLNQETTFLKTKLNHETTFLAYIDKKEAISMKTIGPHSKIKR